MTTPTSRFRLAFPGFSMAIAITLACHGRAPAPPHATTQTGAPVAVGAPAPSALKVTLAERLADEAKQRPRGALRPEDAKEAFSRAGISLEGWQQVLASPVGASFCMAGHTAKGVGVALCEFPDEATAVRGRDYSHATFDRLIPHRRLALKRSTLLTLAPPPGSAAAEHAGDSAPDEAGQIQRTFASL